MTAFVKPLTSKQKEVFDFINSFILENGFAPSLQEIANFLETSNLSTAQYYVEELKNKRHLIREPHKNRGISINQVIASVPILGTIEAGKPIDPVEESEPVRIPTNIRLDKNYPHYALKVRGDSMLDMGILNEDIVLIRYQTSAENGDVIVGITELGATLKVFRMKNGKIFLEPKNKKYKNIHPKKLEIRGKFCGLIRSA
jgi:repressor LexA